MQTYVYMHTCIYVCIFICICRSLYKSLIYMYTYIQMPNKHQVTQEKSLSASEEKSIHKFQLRVKHPKAEECLKPKILFWWLYRFHLVLFSSISLTFCDFFHCFFMLVFSFRRSSVPAQWLSVKFSFVIPVYSTGFVDLPEIVHIIDCTNIRTQSCDTSTLLRQAPYPLQQAFSCGKFSEMAHRHS